MKCNESQSLFSPYVDGVLDGVHASALARHLRSCPACSAEFDSLRKTQSLVASLGRKPAPSDLALKLKVAISRERSLTFDQRMQRYVLGMQEMLNGFMIPATGGLLTAILMFGLMIGFFALPRAVSANNDVPTGLYTPPRLAAAPFSISVGSRYSDAPVVIEAYINAKGRLQDYRIISGEDSEDVRRELDRSLIFTVFEPATSFGEPAEGRVVLSFARVNVKG